VQPDRRSRGSRAAAGPAVGSAPAQVKGCEGKTHDQHLLFFMGQHLCIPPCFRAKKGPVCLNLDSVASAYTAFCSHGLSMEPIDLTGQNARECIHQHDFAAFLRSVFRVSESLSGHGAIVCSGVGSNRMQIDRQTHTSSGCHLRHADFGVPLHSLLLLQETLSVFFPRLESNQMLPLRDFVRFFFPRLESHQMLPA